MWLLSMLTCLVVALVMWLTNHGGTVDTKLALAKKNAQSKKDAIEKTANATAGHPF